MNTSKGHRPVKNIAQCLGHGKHVRDVHISERWLLLGFFPSPNSVSSHLLLFPYLLAWKLPYVLKDSAPGSYF